jgi:hypothetical protein
MKYIDSVDIEKVRQFLIIEEEKCGYLVSNGENRLVLTDNGLSGNDGRHLCNYMPPYQKYIWHTHPNITQSYPSTEDILKIITPRTKNVVNNSIIFTRWGLWELSSKFKSLDKISKSVKSNLDKAYGGLYHITEKGRGILKSSALPLVQSYIIQIMYSLQDWGYQMSFTDWDSLVGTEYYVRDIPEDFAKISYFGNNDDDDVYSEQDDLFDNGCTAAVKNGSLKLLIKARARGFPWEDDTSWYAAEGGYLDCLKYCRDNGCHWDKLTTIYAAENGNLQCLKYAHENNCPWDENTCSDAAENGHINCLKYAHENGCPWDENTCSKAASSGEIDCLKYAHENGCSWNEDTCSYAALQGRFECLKYAHENECPWDENTCSNAAHYDELKCLMYAYENNCPWPDFTNKKHDNYLKGSNHTILYIKIISNI